jgi:hypothetical protein
LKIFLKSPKTLYIHILGRGRFLILTFCLPLIFRSIHLLFFLLIISFLTVLWLVFRVNTPTACIVFLVYISGLLVAFSYLISLSPNSKVTNISGLGVFSLLIIISGEFEHITIDNLNGFEEGLTCLYEHQSIFYLLLVFVLLLVTLLVVVNLVYNPKKSLRGI